MLDMAIVIGLGGKAGSGKSTCANLLEKKGYKVGWTTI